MVEAAAVRLFGLEVAWRPEMKSSGISLNQLIERLEAAYETVSGIAVTPESALQSPTVAAVDRAISTYISALPVHVLQETTSNGRTTKERLPSHPVARLLAKPNDWQDRVTYWLDATSWLIRYGNYYAFKGRGVTGPIRRLEPLHPGAVTPKQDDDLSVTYRVHRSGGGQQELDAEDVHHARLRAKDGVVGDSPVMQVREAIALEIAAEKFGASFFGNGAMPFLIFQFIQGSQGFKTEEQRNQFLTDFQQAYGGRNRMRALLLPRGLEAGDPDPVNNEHAQFLETRTYQRTVIASAWGVPPHKVGDLARMTYNNFEHATIDFVQNCILPYVRVFEAAMERDLLTDSDRAQGVKIRFNLDGALRGDFASRQAGLKIQREAGVINPNEWREHEGMNPRTDPGGETYWDEGPSGQQPKPEEPATEPEPEPRAPAMSGRNGRG